MPDGYNRRKQTAYCSHACRMADWMFKQWQSDKEIERRMRNAQTDEGSDDEA
jgi:hypothetical protein